MPEGDTVFAAAARLRSGLEGKRLIRTDFRIPALATADLSGRTVTAVRSRGKHLLIDVDGEPALSIHSHLKMEGAWHVHAVGKRWRRPSHHARVVLRTETAEAVGFELGILELVTNPDAALAFLGPDLLGPDEGANRWNPDRATGLLAARPDRPIGEALLDQRNLAGIGNVYRSEICFLRGILPMRPVAEVDLPPVVELSRRLLWANRLRTARTTTGATAPNARLWVYGRASHPCRRCGTLIDRTRIGSGNDAERIAYFCPRCQS